MDSVKLNVERLINNLKQLKILLIVLSLIEFGYLFLVFFDSKLWVYLALKYRIDWIVGIFHFVVIGIFSSFISRKMAVKNYKNSIFMIVVLGIVGMWLWFPNKNKLRELEKRNEQ